MTIHTFEDWLAAEQPFKPGIRLYWALGGKDPRWKAIFDEWPVGGEVRAQLYEALRVLSAPLMAHVPQVAYHAPATDAAIEPPAIHALRLQARELHKRQDQLFYTMQAGMDTQTDAQRFEYAQELMEQVIPALDDIYDTIREFERTGRLPEQQQATDKVDSDMKTKLSARSRISRLRKRIAEGGTPAEIAAWQKEIEEKQKLIERL